MSRQDYKLLLVALTLFVLCLVYATRVFPVGEVGTMCCEPLPQ